MGWTEREVQLLADLLRDFLAELTSGIPGRELELIGPHIADTPRRVAKMFTQEILSGYQQNPQEILSAVFEDTYDEMLLVRDIPFFSTCAHHLVTFSGVAHVAYIPKGKVVGLSKLARLVDCFSRRLQIQEKMTQEIAQAIQDILHPRGVGVIVSAEHFCMASRGVSKPGAKTVTSTLLGEFRDDHAVRAEFLSLVNHGGRQ